LVLLAAASFARLRSRLAVHGRRVRGERMDLNTFYKIPCGMYIVSTAHGGKLNGQIVNAVVQVTAEPPKIAVSLNKQNLTCQLCERSGVFALSVLEPDTPMTFIGRWGFKSGRDIDKFEGVGHRTGKNGAPIVLDHALACFEAEVVQSVDLGTHTLLIGKVTEAEVLRDIEPMSYAYYRTVKKGLTSKLAASYQAKPAAAAPPHEVSVPPLVAPARWRCNACGYIYDPVAGIPDAGIKPGTAFEALPADWRCPVCGAGKDRFTALPG
jgi:flavin reductase (DIM6/NTAB) family NADH-FMN oxidoreductase RutF/rubredoxin